MLECRKFKGLGTDIEIRLVFDAQEKPFSADKLLDEAHLIYKKNEKIFSRFIEDSELSKANNNIGKFISVSEEFIEICKKSIEKNKSTGGLFDPRVLTVLKNIGYSKSYRGPDFGKAEKSIYEEDLFDKELEGEILFNDTSVSFLREMDFSGIAKGYITDKVSDFLRAEGCKNFLVDSGGDMYFEGSDESGESWAVDIEGFRGSGLVMEMKNSAIATSGITRRKWDNEGRTVYHIINPKDKDSFPLRVKSVSVVSKKTEDADVMAKILFIMGKDRGMEYCRKNKIKAVFIDSKGNAFITSDLKKIIKQHK